MKKFIFVFIAIMTMAIGRAHAENVWEGLLTVTGWDKPFTVTLSQAPKAGDILTFTLKNTTNSFAFAAAEGAEMILSKYVGTKDEQTLQLQVTVGIAEKLNGTNQLTFYRGNYTLASIDLQTSEFASQINENTVWFANVEDICNGWARKTVPSEVFKNVKETDYIMFHCSPADFKISLLDGVNYWGSTFASGQCVNGVYTLSIEKTDNPATVVENLKKWGVGVTGNNFSLNFVDISADGVTSELSDISVNTNGNKFDIYNLNGVLIKKNVESFDGLPSGLYLSEGKKILVR